MSQRLANREPKIILPLRLQIVRSWSFKPSPWLDHPPAFLQNKLGLLSLPWLTAHHDLFFFHLWPQVASFPYSWKSPLIAPEDMARGMGTDAPRLLFNGPSQKATYTRGLFKRGQGSCARWTGQMSNKKVPHKSDNNGKILSHCWPRVWETVRGGIPTKLSTGWGESHFVYTTMDNTLQVNKGLRFFAVQR